MKTLTGAVAGSLVAVLVCINIANAAVVSIVIDDVGYDRKNSLEIAKLSPAITLALLPGSPHAFELAAFAQSREQEVMLHLPMQGMFSGHAQEPGTLTVDMSEEEIKQQTRELLGTFSSIRGVNNHQGSLFTRHPGHMDWVLDVIKEHGDLYFLDSRTHAQSIAHQLSSEKGLPSTYRDFFLDAHGDDAVATGKQLEVIKKALRNSEFVLIIAHPYDTSVNALRELIKTIRREGHTLLPTSIYITLHDSYTTRLVALEPE